MEDRDLDKLLKEKLKGKISASPELERKINAKIEEQKTIHRKSKNKKSKYAILKPLISMAAVVLIVFAIGLKINPEIFEEDTSVCVIKSIEPTKLNSGILANDSEFIIQADENSTTESVQRSVYIEPALEYTIEKTRNDNEYKLKFTQNIPDNTIVKLQYVKNEITQNSWAYQTSNKLSVTRVYPEKDEGFVSKNTVIEIEFSYSNIENFEENVLIEPNIEGKWEQFGKVWRLTPSHELDLQKYIVTVKNGITAGNEKLENDYMYSFTVAEDDNIESIKYNSYSIDGINTYTPDELVKIQYNNWGGVTSDISTVEINKFKSLDSFINYLDSGIVENIDNSENYDFKLFEDEQYITLNKSLKEGYYIARVKTSKGKELFNCPIQINTLNAYAMETERDVLVWVADKTGLAKNISVEFQGKEEKTNSDGIAKFIGILDGSESVKYAKIGNSENKLIVGLYNYKFDNYPMGYLYTDRPMYKNTDTIKIWGFVPRKLFYDKVEDEFYIELNDENKKKVKVDDDGNFNYEIKLNNHFDYENSSVSLYYKDEQIANKIIGIENYELQNYEYEIIRDKNYAYTGSTYEFDVRVKHITGLVVPNKPVVVEYGDEKFNEYTSENGIAHFAISIEEEEDSDIYYVNRKEINVYNGDLQETTTSETFSTLYVISRSVKAQVEEKNNKIFEIALHKLSNDKNTNVSYDLEEIYDGTYDTEIKVNLVENVFERVFNGYFYDEYTKKQEPQYEWVSNENIIELETITTKKGVAQFDANNVEFKKGTEDFSYSYNLQFEFKDTNGNTVKETCYIQSYDEFGSGNPGFYYDMFYDYSYSSDELYEIPKDINTENYYTYRYFFKAENNKFSIGETKKFTLCESLEDNSKEIKNEGKLLRIIFKENISKTDIITNNNYDYKFTEEDFPGCKMTSAYYYKGKFYRMPIYYFDINEEDRKLDISIKTDKEKYEPGEEVTVKVKTTKKGKPVKTFVNLSVVNEAVFEIEEDYTNILETIYLEKNYPVYTYSSYMDYLNDSSGGGGGGGEPRGKFADTAHFETIHTNLLGEAKIKFKLPDNVTTYRITAHAANEDMYVGVNKTNITSALEFFVQSVAPRNVKVTDDLVLNATSIAEEKYDVNYEFTIKELNKTLTATATTNSIASVNFGKLDYGTYHVVIKGTHGKNQDSIEYTFNVIESAQEIKAKTEMNINDGAKITPTKNPICLEIYNKNMTQYLKYIDFIENTKTLRLDTQIAYNEAIILKNKYYQTENTINFINVYDYTGEKCFKNLPASNEDLLLTALISYYAKEYYSATYLFNDFIKLVREDANLFEIYLLAASKNEPVLNDLIVLKEENEISNYNKLLLSLSFEFLGDYQNAREVYETISLNSEEATEYKSLIAIVETFINKSDAVNKINEMIEENPADEYLRFAILSFFKNSTEDLNNKEEVEIICGSINEKFTLNGMQVQTYFVSNEDLKDINFKTSSNDLMVSYYYQTSLENAESVDIRNDIRINIDGDLKKNNTVYLQINFENTDACDFRISLPNALRLATSKSYIVEDMPYYIINNNIDYVVVHKQKDYNYIEIPLQIIYEGEYKFESIVAQDEYTYHISNSLDLNIQ